MFRDIVLRGLLVFWVMLFFCLVAGIIGYGMAGPQAIAPVVMAAGVAYIVIISAYSLITGVPPIPSDTCDQEVILKAIGKKDPATTIYELGSGWGTLVFVLAKKYPKSHIVGFELSPIPYYFSRLALAWYGYKNVTLRQENFLKAKFDNPGLVVCYLFPEILKKLQEKLRTDLSKGTQIICQAFKIDSWTPVKTLETEGRPVKKHIIYVYKV